MVHENSWLAEHFFFTFAGPTQLYRTKTESKYLKKKNIKNEDLTRLQPQGTVQGVVRAKNMYRGDQR